jgi:hypothetical protein
VGDNLRRLAENGPPQIAEFVKDKRNAGWTDFEILAVIKQTVDQSPKE